MTPIYIPLFLLLFFQTKDFQFFLYFVYSYFVLKI